MVSFAYYRRLYDLERNNGLRIAHRLTESHINPSCFEKMNVRKAAQLLSDSVVRAIRHYRANSLFGYLFKGSENTERFTKLMNDVFDVMNGRFIKNGITVINWHKKKKLLDSFLSVLDITEKIHRSRMPGDPTMPKMFCSQTTLDAWRLTIISAIHLTEDLFSAGLYTVLLGKTNQDPIEVI